ncbi:TrmH family RNA methyltransferase [Niabella aquatica]
MLNKSEVKYIQSLSQKKFRQEEGIYLIEGPKITGEALASQEVKITKVYALEEWAGNHATSCPDVMLQVVSASDLQRISQLKTPNQVLALAEIPTGHFRFRQHLLSLALDGIQDPGNLGTIIRIADWFGIEQIICSKDCADAFSPKVVQATMGSIFRVKLLYTDLDGWMAAQPDTCFYGAALNGTPLKKIPPLSHGVIVIGNESKGIRSDIMKRVAQKITIERWGMAESLNAAVATGIILSHVK